MALTTFGAIMGFAADIVGETEETYKALVQKAKAPAFKETLQILLGEEKKNRSLMEKTRRENVTEMILEPITGLRQEDYEVSLTVQDRMEDADLLKAALLLEEREKKFFQDTSLKVSLPEVARIFRKIVQKKEDNISKLQSLGMNQSLRKT